MRRGRRTVLGAGLLSLAVAAVAFTGLAFTGLLRSVPDPAPQDRALPPLAIPAAPGAPLRIVALGTSLTAYYDWPDRLSTALGACLARPVEVSVVAKGGMGSAWGLEHVASVAAMAPDIVLVEFAVNDADLRLMTPLSASTQTHRQIVAELRAARPGARIVLMTMSPARGLRGLLRPRLARHYASYRPLAADLDTGLVDLYPRWLARPDPAAGMGDGVHPDREVAAGVILPVLVPYLATLAGGCA